MDFSTLQECPSIVHDPPSIFHDEDMSLSVPFTNLELCRTVRDMKAKSSPVNDGFPIEFNRAFCTVLGGVSVTILNNAHETAAPAIFSVLLGCPDAQTNR